MLKLEEKSKSASLSPSKLLLSTSKLNSSLKNVTKYVKSSFENTYFLGYRDIPVFLEKYTLGKKAVDYGCGTGRSTRFLKAHGFEVIGVDISKQMLKEAVNLDPESHYLHIKNGKAPVFDSSYDLVFSCFVMFTVPTKKDLLSILSEAYRCLRDEGTFIIVTGSEELYSHQWLSYNTDYPENKNLSSGDIARIQLRDLDIELVNYYWTDSDYKELFQQANFKILEKHYPLGRPSERTDWISETTHSPYVVYVLQK